MNGKKTFFVLCLIAAMIVVASSVSTAKKITTDPKQQLPDPDTRPPVTDKPIKVFILMGQSNMLGFGRINPETTKGTLACLAKKEGKYPHLVDDDGSWTVRNDVWYAKVTVGQRQHWLQPKGKHIGPELQFGHVMGHIHDEPVLIIEASQGNRSLGWDILPPGSERFTYDGKTYAGYKDTPSSWIEGEEKKPVNWYAGKQYDDFVRDIHEVLNNLPKFYPDYKEQGYEITGFAWWQGHKDQNAAHASRYEQNLVRLIKTLRKEFKAPNTPFVLATIAFGGWDLKGPGLTVANAQLAVSGEKGKYPEFVGNVKTVEARDFWRDKSVSPSGAGYHYNHNAETHMEVGNALGWAMADLLAKEDTGTASNNIEALKADMTFFSDPSCRQLKLNVQSKDLKEFKSDLLKTVAAEMLKGTYDTTYRAAKYEAYPSPRELGRTLKLGDGFSRYENITGICLDAGENVVFVGDTAGKELSLLVPNWMRKPAEGVRPTKDPNGWGLHKQRIALEEGANLIDVRKGGNVYVSYFDDYAEKAPKIAVHFPTGKVNGFFDISKHTNADWNRLLDEAVSPIMDARGKHIQVAYPVEWFNVYTRGKGVELINNYDALLNSHYTLMGLVKYKKVPRNRLLARVNFNYYMFRDGDGVAYLGNKGTMCKVADPNVVITGDPCWGFSHETGHVLQMRPQMTWGGMTEVSCNIFSMYTVTGMGNKSRLKAQKNYASARKNIIEADPRKSFLAHRDVFDRLVPFWQLHLYFSRNGKGDFYADVMEQMRRRPDAGRGKDSIRNQFEFVKICCDVGELDLTDFFEKWGFFWVGEITVRDYRTYKYTITQQMVDDTKSYIAKKGYDKPTEDITLIED